MESLFLASSLPLSAVPAAFWMTWRILKKLFGQLVKDELRWSSLEEKDAWAVFFIIRCY